MQTQKTSIHKSAHNSDFLFPEFSILISRSDAISEAHRAITGSESVKQIYVKYRQEIIWGWFLGKSAWNRPSKFVAWPCCSIRLQIPLYTGVSGMTTVCFSHKVRHAKIFPLVFWGFESQFRKKGEEKTLKLWSWSLKIPGKICEIIIKKS